MSKDGKPDPEYVKARRVLLDALASLSPHADALDVLRLLQGIGTRELAEPLQRLLAHEVSGEVTRQALDLLLRLVGAEDATGVEMAVRATEGLEEPATLRPSCTVLAAELLKAVRGGGISTDPEGP